MSPKKFCDKCNMEIAVDATQFTWGGAESGQKDFCADCAAEVLASMETPA